MINKPKKNNEIKKLKAKCWKLMSEIVRRKSLKKVGNIYVFECFTCGKRFLKWNELESGHYKHNCLDFFDRNIHAQCTECNCFLHGNLGKYAVALEQKYGNNIFEELEIAHAIERKQTKGIMYYIALKQDLKEQLRILKLYELY